MIEREPPFLTGKLLPALRSLAHGAWLLVWLAWGVVWGVARLACILVGLLVFVGIGATLLLSPDRTIERSFVIAAPPAKVFALVGDLGRWREWSEAARSGTPASVTTPSTGKGARLYRPRQQGPGQDQSFEIVDVNTDRLVRLSIQPGQDFDCRWIELGALFRLSPSPDGASTTLRASVDWEFAPSLRGLPLIDRWIGALFRRAIGPELEKDLQRLKTVAERS